MLHYTLHGRNCHYVFFIFLRPSHGGYTARYKIFDYEIGTLYSAKLKNVKIVRTATR